ncbi:g10845 [Coccomyxa viridis]|uniref:G10845 protein n=1 Tax=Coccomyxa viridis TaxID=1274662 RepID=A0ABP1GDG4_9CHLO
MERFRQYFAEQGLDPKTDIPKAIVLHEVIGLGFAIGFWSLCYTVQPSRTFMRPVASALGRQQTLERVYAASFVRAQHTIQRATWLTKVPLIGRDPGRLTVSLAESICLRAVIKPITFPLKLWLSWKAVLATKGAFGSRGRAPAVASMSMFRTIAPGLAIAHRQG